MKSPQTEAEPGKDELLLIEAARKDPARFGDLYERYFDRVYAYIARRVGNRDAAQDLTADVFHRALANIGKYESRGVPFAAWLFRIAANAIADRWKHAAKESGNPAPEEIDAGELDLEAAENRAPALISIGEKTSCGSTQSNSTEICGRKKYSRHCAGNAKDRRSGETAAIPRDTKFAGSDEWRS